MFRNQLVVLEIILNNNQRKFLNQYYKYDQKTRRKIAQNLFISSFPKFTIEAAAILMAVIFSLKSNSSSNGTNQFITSIGVLALSCQRVLPLIQQLYNGWGITQ